MLRRVLVLALVLGAAPAWAFPPLAPPPAETLDRAAQVLDDFAQVPEKRMPPKLITDAEGIMVIPRVVKAGFVFAGRGGHGVTLVKDEAGQWGQPVFVNLGGASVGLQVGVGATDVILVFRNRRSLDRILAGKGKLTLGGDVAVAAGPVGRQAAAATDGKLEAEIYSYSRSRGLFAGVALDGTVIRPDERSNVAFLRDQRPEMAALVTNLQSKIALLGADVVEVRPAAPPAVIPERP